MKTNTACGLMFVVTSLACGSVRAEDDWDISKLDASKLPPVAKVEGVTYAKDIRPLFEASCFNCHGEKKQKGDLRLDSLEAVLKGGKESKAVVPMDSAKSALVFSIARVHDKIAMPPKPKGGGGGPGAQGPPGAPGAPAAPSEPAKTAGPEAGAPPVGQPPAGNPPQRRPGGPPAKPLTEEQVSLVRAWIDQGAK